MYLIYDVRTMTTFIVYRNTEGKEMLANVSVIDLGYAVGRLGFILSAIGMIIAQIAVIYAFFKHEKLGGEKYNTATKILNAGIVIAVIGSCMIICEFVMIDLAGG